MAVVLIIALLVVLGLAIKYPFVALPLLVGGVIFAVWKYQSNKRKLESMTPEERAAEVEKRAARRQAMKQLAQARRAHRVATASRLHSNISEVAQHTQAGLACPRCGGTQFRAKRSRLAKAALVPTVGVGVLLAPKHWVKCVTCGAEYKRG